MMAAVRSVRSVGEEYSADTDDKAIRVSFQASYTGAGPDINSSEAVSKLVADLLDDFANMRAEMPE
jgi:hypothetical protein